MEISDCICWNGMTEDQQSFLIRVGIVNWDDYGGGPCPNRAEVAVYGEGWKPGPRYYCEECAAKARPQDWVRSASDWGRKKDG